MIRAFAAVLTGGGRGAITAIRLWGDDCVPVVDALFHPHAGIPLSSSPPGRLRVGILGRDAGDEVVGVKIAANPPVYEFQGHAGLAVLNRSLDAFRSEGVQVVEDEEWLRFDGGSTLETQALIDLKSAPTLSVAERLIDQAQGALIDALRRIRTVADVDEMIARGEFGVRMNTGWTVALAGRPNVGKSSLFNALLGFPRAIVDPAAGTTRDPVRARTAIGGWPVELIDLAGIRPSDHPIEREGIERAEATVARADVILLILDRSSPLRDTDRDLLARLPQAILVANKSDLSAAWETASETHIQVSARNGDGVVDLLERIQRRLVPVELEPKTGIPFRPGQVARLRQLRRSLACGQPLPEDLASAIASTDGI